MKPELNYSALLNSEKLNEIYSEGSCVKLVHFCFSIGIARVEGRKTISTIPILGCYEIFQARRNEIKTVERGEGEEQWGGDVLQNTTYSPAVIDQKKLELFKLVIQA